MTKVVLGEWVEGGARMQMDVERFVETRGLIQASSGSGKSVTLRQVLEATHPHVQQIIVDPEGEFASLRETCDLIIAAARDGDVIAHPKTARLLAIRLLETQASAVLDISELKVRERHQFVRLLFESLLEAPKELRHPVLVALDEAHMFAPEKGQGESEALEAVIDMASLGRKRGLSLLAATQRIGKYHKSAAADLKNRLIGNTALDVDVKRAAFDLGMAPKEALAILRPLAPGHFYAFGPAFGRTEPAEMLVAMPKTSHPKVGHKQCVAPPKPSEAIKALLPRLADLPREAEEQARTVADLQRELATARRDLKLALRQQPKAEAPAPRISKAEIDDARRHGYIKGRTEGFERAAKQIQSYLNRVGKWLADVPKQPLLDAGELPELPQVSIHPQRMAPATREALVEVAAKVIADRPASDGDADLKPVQQRILNALAELEQIGAEKPARELVAFMSGYTHLNSKGFTNAMGALRSSALIDYPPGGLVVLTDDGRAAAAPPDAPRTPEELQRRVVDMLGGASGRILKPLIDAYPKSVVRDEVAAAAGYGHLNSKGFTNAIGRLRSLGFIDYPDRGTIVAKPVLFLEAS
jgi:hypothetical protein